MRPFRRLAPLALAFGLLFAAAPATAFEEGRYADQVTRYTTDLARTEASAFTGMATAELERLGMAAQEAEDWATAVSIYEAAVMAAPSDGGFWLALAEAQSRANPYNWQLLAAAYAAYLHADTDKARARALTVLAQAMVRWGDGRRAIDAAAEAAELAPSEESAAYVAELQDRFGFRIFSTYARNETDIPAICLDFSDPLADVRRVNYRDHIRIAPATPVEPILSGNQLCIEGVEFGETYEVTVRPGIESRDGLVLRREDSFTVTVDDRPPTTAFYGNAYVLPRHGEGTLPLTTINIDEVLLRLIRINDRSLARQVVDGSIGEILWSRSVTSIADNDGVEVWSGRMSVTNDPNRSVVTGVPVETMLPAPEPGVYLLSARNAVEQTDEYGYWEDTPPATQWLVVTDLGLATFSGLEGMTVAVRSLDTAQPQDGVQLALVARNNTILAEAESDAEGLAAFPAAVMRGEGGDRPAVVMAYGEADFTFLDLTGAAFDLSDRGVSGRAEPGPLDAYLYTERGVYRPGESVALTALLRDERARALPGLPLTIRVLRPDGVEAQLLQLTDQGGGGLSTMIEIPPTAYTGVWTAEALVDPDGVPIGATTFQVEDFVPARLRVGLETALPELREDAPTPVTLSAAFLYGAPAADLATEAELTIRAASTPWPAYAGWSFGLVQDETVSRFESLTTPRTDADGTAAFDVRVGALPDTTRPLEAVLRAAVLDTGGRPANATQILPIRRDRPSIGLRRTGPADLPEGASAAFEIVALDGDGDRTALDLEWALIRETRDYQWYSYGRTWEYEVILREQVVQEGRVSAGTEAPADIAARVDWGTYRLDVWNAASGAASSLRFSAGWWMSDEPNPAPDRLTVALDADSYAPGGTMEVHVDAPFAGEALVIVANDRVLAAQNVTLGPDGTSLAFEIGEDWGAGAYVLATAFRPGAAPGERVIGPARAVGLDWFGIDVSARTLSVAIEAPDDILPRQTLPVAVTVDGAGEGDAVWLTLAAVDEGILLLTDFASPDPTGHYFARRALGLDLRDAYGRLIVSHGERGQPRVGGDAPGDQRMVLQERSTRTVALFSGIVMLGPEGRAVVPLDIPDFAGELRLMAVAWSASAIGAADRAMLVRDPVVAELVTPRFLAPGDSAQFAFTLRNLSGAEGAYRVRLELDAPLRATGSTEHERTLALGQELRVEVPVSADAIGVGSIRAVIEGPEGFSLDHEWALSVRAPQPLVTERLVSRLAPGERAVWDDEILRSYLAEGLTVSGSLSTRPSFDVAGLLRELDGYPYGCLEQTTSRALPLLYAGEIAARIGETWRGDDLHRRVQGAIDRVLTMQMPDGAFGVWGPFDGQDAWLSAYATDFLLRARDQGYRVPDRALRLGLRHLANYLDSWDARDSCNPVAAYALYVAARGGAVNVGTMRTLLDSCLARYETPMAQALAGAAAAQFFDAARTEQAFALAMSVDRPEGRIDAGSYDYGSALRDRAAVAALAAEAGRPLDEVLDQADRAADAFARQRWHSTQELAWMVLAADAALADAGPLTVTIDGRAATAADGVLPFVTGPEALHRGVEVENTAEAALRAVVTIRGVPAKPRPASFDGFEIERILLDRAGEVIDPSVTPIAQGELVTVLLRGRVTDTLAYRALIVDLLPAGFEIENPDLGEAAQLGEIDAVMSYPTHTEMRDDRFVAALDFYAGGDPYFAVAYLARAVTPGSFVLPPAFVEDMYAPEISGRTAMGRVTIVGN